MKTRLLRSAKTEKRKNELPSGDCRLSVRALTVAYVSGKQSLVALRDVSLNVEVGELVGLVGPNGSGKTTLIRAVTKVTQPLGGEIRIGGDDVASLAQVEIARRVAVVPQEPLLPGSVHGPRVRPDGPHASSASARERGRAGL